MFREIVYACIPVATMLLLAEALAVEPAATKADVEEQVFASMQARLDAMSNVDMVSTTKMYNCYIENGELGARTADSGRFEFRLRHLEGAYRLDSKWYLTQEESTPTATCAAFYSDEDGTCTSAGTSKGLEGQFARIDRRHEQNMRSNQGAVVLGIITLDMSQDYFRDAIDNAASCKVVHEGDVVRVEYSHPVRLAPDGIGMRRITLDKSRGLMPTQIESWWGTTNSENKPWRRETITLAKPVKVDDLWMPTEIVSVTLASILEKSIGSVVSTTIDSLKFGTVSPAELKVQLAPGTEVVDAIKGVKYIAGDNGARLEQEALYAPSEMQEPKQPKSQGVSVWLVTNAFIIVAIVLGMVYRHLAHRSA